jgi:hypothetical protein
VNKEWSSLYNSFPIIFMLIFTERPVQCIYNEGNETSRRKITVTSSFNETSTDQLGNRVVVRREGVTPPAPAPFFIRLLDRYLKTT